MLYYTPFGKELQALVVDDLENLKQASEGWYIEYKREIPNAKAIAKSISAFANTYGGWLFFGVQEGSKEHPVAGAFPGIPRTELDATLQRMRKAVAEHANPSPHFETKVLLGPCEKIGLSKDRAVVCVRIPWSANAPHIHKSGVIYRRVSDASEPRPENDRFVLDQLWRRAEDFRREYEEWHNHDPEFSEGETEQPYVRLMLTADLWKDRDAWLDASIDEIRTILGATQGLMSAIPFDTVYTSAGGFVGRQLSGNNPHNLTLTWHLRRTLVSDVLIPLPLYTPSDPKVLLHEMHGYESIERFVSLLERYNHTSPRVVDLNYLFNILIGVAEIQKRLAARAAWKHSYFVKAKLLNAWRTTPFIDVSTILDNFERYGPPMCLDSNVTSPLGTDPNTFIEISDYTKVDSEHTRILIQSVLIFSPIARALGIPTGLDYDKEGQFNEYYEALQQAGRRAIEFQRSRNVRLAKKQV
jgi:hypothetical protein